MFLFFQNDGDSDATIRCLLIMMLVLLLLLLEFTLLVDRQLITHSKLTLVQCRHCLAVVRAFHEIVEYFHLETVTDDPFVSSLFAPFKKLRYMPNKLSWKLKIVSYYISDAFIPRIVSALHHIV